MPPKLQPASSASPPESTSGDDSPTEEPAEKKPEASKTRRVDPGALRKLSTHPTTLVMVKEALTALDSRKGVSSQAIQNYIKQKYPSVDLVRLKYLVRNTLKKGMDNGTYVRPANAAVTAGAQGKFRLAPKVKELKPKSVNAERGETKAPKVAKNGPKKPPKADAVKSSEAGEKKTSAKSKPAKKSKTDENAPPKTAAAKKVKSKKAEANAAEEAAPEKPKVVKKPRAKPKAADSKAAKAGSETSATKTTKKGKKAA